MGCRRSRALINHICSGYVSLMPELKHDREVKGEEDPIKEEGEERWKIETFETLYSPYSSSSLPLCVCLLLYRHGAAVATFSVHA